MQTINIGSVTVSRFLLGSNPFSGFSHQSVEVDEEMLRYFKAERIKATLREAESLGITAMVGRADHFIMRVLYEYWDEGGKIQWFAQTCPGAGGNREGINRAESMGAKACHIHGGVMDNLLLNNQLEELPELIAMIRSKGMLAGIAGHIPAVFEWAEDNLDVDYYLCCYYNPIPRKDQAEHVHGYNEAYLEEDRQAMTSLIQRLSKPVIHYKVMAAGRNDPHEAFEVVAHNLRPTDAVCVGVFTRDKSDMLREDVDLFEAALQD